MGPRSTHTNRAGRRRVLVRTGVVAVAASLTAAGSAGTALAAPSSLAAAVAGQEGITLTGEQAQQLQSQLATRRDAGRPAGLPVSGPASFFVELDTPATSEVYAEALQRSGAASAADAARSAKGQVAAAADRVIDELPAAVPDAAVLYSTTTVLPGVAVRADATDYDTLADLPGVTAVHPITPKSPSNAGAADVVQAVQAWEDLGNTGEDVSIGIIDTGIDYTHTAFGGSGSVEQYDELLAAEDQPAPAGVFPNAKVVGGYDFAGDSYNADPTSPDYQPVATPDPNPLDCNGHGTHVAGTAAGYGVNTDGSTYRGGYEAGLDPYALRIGPGMAPEADLYALKVFGCEGSTDVTMQAIDWALDPDQDGDPSDHLDVVNLSLGSDFGLADDADSQAIDRAMELGMLAVVAAGNAGDSYDIGGSPGNAPRGIGVAATNDGYGVFDGWQVLAPEGLLDGVRPGLRSIAYSDVDESGAVKPDVTGDLVLAPADNADACAPLPEGYATGQVLLVEANDFVCGSVAKGTNALAAGAVGFMIIDDDDLLETGITGVEEIPGILVTATDGAALAGAVADGQTVTVTFGPSLKDASVFTAPDQVDLIASFTSRGVRQERGLKPDVAAPGVTVFSAAVGTGENGVSESGTSMATPVTAGVTALIRAAHPDWTTEQVKADLMNTAVHDVYSEPGQTGAVYGPNRVGAGRIDAALALQNQVLAFADAGSGVVSAAFGVVEVTEGQQTLTKTITVENHGASAAVYRVAYESLVDQPGTRWSLDDLHVAVPPGQSRQVSVTLTLLRDDLRRVADPTIDSTDGRQFLGESSGRVVFHPVNGKGVALRVPVHANPKPASTLTATASEGGDTITLTGEGVANGPAFEPSSYTSLVNAFEHLGSSPELPQCTTDVVEGCYRTPLERSVDLAEVGVASDVVTYEEDPGVYFAVSAYGKATSPETAVNYGVYLDGDGDGVWDYQVTTTRLADFDQPLVVVTDREYNLLPSPEAPYAAPLNLLGGSVDTNTFDSSVQVLGAPLSVMPLITGRFSFGVQAASAYDTIDDLGTVTAPSGMAELAPEAMSFDPLDPGLSFTGPDGRVALLLPATDGTTIDVLQDPESYAADDAIGADKGALIVLPQNDTATGQAQTVPIPGGDGALPPVVVSNPAG